MGPYALKAEHLTKKFGDLTVVNDLSLAIRKSEVFGFLGPNGAGKTTSIKMMVGLLRPTRGRVLFDGAEMLSVQKKRRIGICPQELVLWNTLTCRENLAFIGKMYRIQKPLLDERVDALLQLLSLADQADRMASKLSGGMKRRLNIALALVHNPELVFLDEPSAGLDPQTRQLLWDFIRSLRDEGKTVVLTTHVMEEADALSDRIAIIDHGKLLKLGTPRNLKKTLGKGDIIELQLAYRAMNETLLQRLRALDGIEEVFRLKGRVAVRALNASSRLPDIINLIESACEIVSDITIHGNTLEDVFIHLTGRALRE